MIFATEISHRLSSAVGDTGIVPNERAMSRERLCYSRDVGFDARARGSVCRLSLDEWVVVKLSL